MQVDPATPSPTTRCASGARDPRQLQGARVRSRSATTSSRATRRASSSRTCSAAKVRSRSPRRCSRPRARTPARAFCVEHVVRVPRRSDNRFTVTPARHHIWCMNGHSYHRHLDGLHLRYALVVVLLDSPRALTTAELVESLRRNGVPIHGPPRQSRLRRVCGGRSDETRVKRGRGLYASAWSHERRRAACAARSERCNQGLSLRRGRVHRRQPGRERSRERAASHAIRTRSVGVETTRRYLRRVSSARVPGGVVHKLPPDLRDALVGNATALDRWKDINAAGAQRVSSAGWRMPSRTRPESAASAGPKRNSRTGCAVRAAGRAASTGAHRQLKTTKDGRRPVLRATCWRWISCRWSWRRC